jgi:PhnB protein
MESAMQLTPYLFFDGRCEQALAFYRQALGAEILMQMRYREAPDPPPPGMLPPGSDDKIMHSQVRVGGAEFMASDGSCKGKPAFQGFSLSIGVPTEGEVDRIFAALAEQGRVDMPAGKTFWSARFGMVTDRFGVQWMVGIPPQP